MKKQEPKKRITITGIILIVVLIGMWLGLRMLINPFGAGTGEFNSYRGPVLPMTSLNGAEGVEVQRNVDFDFSPYQKPKDYSNLGKGAAEITDTYILTNITGETKKLELVYGFQGQFIDHPEEFPTITLDGMEIEPTLYPSVDTEELVWNAQNYEQYSQVINGNDFLKISIQECEELNIPVTAYHFTELSYDGDEVAADPMLTLRFSVDENTAVWTMVAHEYGADEDGRTRMMFRVDYGEAWVFTFGGKLIDPEYGGNKDYNITETSAVDGVNFKLETYETTLSEVIWELAQQYDFWSIEGQDAYPNSGYMTPELLTDGAVKRIHTMGYLEPSNRIRMIEAVFYEVITEPRMMYLVFPVELEAGQSVTVEASFIQEPSLDISGPKDYREGYDLATKLGSDLRFTELTSSLSNTDSIELGNQNFGFDLGKGITEVILDLQVERYYLEVKIKK